MRTAKPAMCRYFAGGCCKNGSKCKFNHSPSQLELARRNDRHGASHQQIDDGKEQIKYLQHLRRQTIQQGQFLDYKELESQLHEEFGETKRWSKRLVDHCNSIRRILSTIEISIDAAIATHQLLTLHDLQEILMENKDFKELYSFENVKVGSLLHHRKIIAYFRPSERIKVSKIIPKLSSLDILNEFLDEMRPGGMLQQINSTISDDDDPHEVYREKIRLVLDNVALAKGWTETADLCVYIKGHSFIVWLLSFSRRHMNDIQSSFKEALADAAEQYDENVMRDAMAVHIDLMEADALEKLRGAAAWWRRVRKHTSGLDTSLALAFVKRCITTYPRISQLLIPAASKGTSPPKGDDSLNVTSGRVSMGSRIDSGPGSWSCQDHDEDTRDDSGSEHDSPDEEGCDFWPMRGSRGVSFRDLTDWGPSEMRFDGYATARADCCCPPSYKAYFEIEILDLGPSEREEQQQMMLQVPGRQEKAAPLPIVPPSGCKLDDDEWSVASGVEEEGQEENRRERDGDQDQNTKRTKDRRHATTLLRCGFMMPAFRASRRLPRQAKYAQKATAPAFRVGDRVVLSGAYRSCEDAEDGPLSPGQEGFVVRVDPDPRTTIPYLVSTQRIGGISWWYHAAALDPADGGSGKSESATIDHGWDSDDSAAENSENLLQSSGCAGPSRARSDEPAHWHAAQKTRRPFKVGDRVVLSSAYLSCADAADGPLSRCQEGFVIEVDSDLDSDKPYLVSHRRTGGIQWWYQAAALERHQYGHDNLEQEQGDDPDPECEESQESDGSGSEVDGSSLGGDTLSWAWDGLQRARLHGGEATAMGGAAWTAGTVLGLACDMESRRLRLSVDGRFDESFDGGGFEVPPGRVRLLPAVAMDRGMLRYNLGGAPFRFAPPGEGYLSFASLKALLQGQDGPRYESILRASDPGRPATVQQPFRAGALGRGVSARTPAPLRKGDLVMLAGNSLGTSRDGLRPGEVGWLMEVDSNTQRFKKCLHHCLKSFP